MKYVLVAFSVKSDKSLSYRKTEFISNVGSILVTMLNDETVDFVSVRKVR